MPLGPVAELADAADLKSGVIPAVAKGYGRA